MGKIKYPAVVWLGSKRRIANQLIPLLEGIRAEGQVYVEPLCGGCNSLIRMKNPRIGNDVNHYWISALIATQNGWSPPSEYTKEDYNLLRKNPYSYPPELVGWACSQWAFGGRWMGSMDSRMTGRVGKGGVVATAYRKIDALRSCIQGVDFVCSDYKKLEVPPNSLIYCDPPYMSSTSGNDNYIVSSFDFDEFVTWMKQKANEGHTVLFSEFVDFDDPRFLKLFEKPQTTNFGNKGCLRTEFERVYLVEPQHGGLNG